MDKLSAVKELGCDAVFVGSDWKGTPAWDRYERELAEVGCEVVYFEHTEGDLLNDIEGENGERAVSILVQRKKFNSAGRGRGPQIKEENDLFNCCSRL